MTVEAEMERHGHKPRDAWASRSWEAGRILPQTFRHLNLRLPASRAVRDSMQPQDTCTDLFEDWGEVLPLKAVPRAGSVHEPGLAKPTLPGWLAALA